jgi:hypothetical protein
MKQLAMVLLGLAMGTGAAWAQPSAAQLDRSVQMGTVASLASVCGLRNEAWIADLRRATIQSATGSRAHDDAGLHEAQGSDQVTGALGYADHEALESFAEAPPGETCGPLAHSKDLDQADRLVRAFREQAPAS